MRTWPASKYPSFLVLMKKEEHVLKGKKKFVVKMQVRNWLVCPNYICNSKIFILSFIL